MGIWEYIECGALAGAGAGTLQAYPGDHGLTVDPGG